MGLNSNVNPYDVLQSIIDQLESTGITPKEIVMIANKMSLQKYCTSDDDQNGRIKISSEILSTALNLQSTAYLAEDSQPLDVNDPRYLNSIHAAIRMGLSSLFFAEELGMTREEIRDMLIEFIRSLANSEVCQTDDRYPITNGKGWMRLLDADMTDARVALIANVTTQENLIWYGIVPDMDRILEEDLASNAFERLRNLLERLALPPDPVVEEEEQNKENNMTIKNNKKTQDAINELNEIKEKIESEKTEPANEPQKVTVKKELSWKKAGAFFLAGAAVGVGATIAYNIFTDDSTTLTSRN